jgi:anthranilate phosphoribosyltransferase
MIRDAIIAVVAGKSLSKEEAQQVTEEIMTGQATPAQIAAFLTALRVRGETVDEIVGMAMVMRAKATRVPISVPVVDTCGTGGDASGTFNISTAAALVAAGAGVKVAKHGNRAMSSQCGSADVLEALGVKIELTPEQVATCIREVGFGFLFAPAFHPAMKFAAGPRREIGIRTIFNILGPLTNPAGARNQLLGVADASLLAKLASALSQLGSQHSWVVHGQDGVDELSLCAPTTIYEQRGGDIRSITITPEDAGLPRAKPQDLKGGSAQENAAILRRLLRGEQGPHRDVVLLNAGAVLVVAGKAATLREGVEQARQAVDSGAASKALDALLALTKGFGS